VTDENFYFVMADRFENGSAANDLGGLPAEKMTSGYDPTDRAFYHGGDLQGITRRLDYIRGLGTTSVWLTPSFKNRAVQPADKSAGYHGYWITDFTQIDPHLGTNEDLRTLVREAQSRGMKVYFDIITNHTADVIAPDGEARKPYISKDQEPYRTAAGEPFDDRDFAGTDAFPPLDPETSFPYKPVIPEGSVRKFPEWLNDPTLYHNRGDTTFVGEDSLYGDFFGLDDLFTEHPRVVRGMIDIYKAWIKDFGIDGFRIDTMKHVDDEFWQQFGPEVLEYARAQGKPEFFMFGEVFDTTKAFTSHFTTRDRIQAVLDFPFQAAAQTSRPTRAPRTGSPTSSRTTTGTRTPTPTPTSCRPSSAITTWAGSAASSRWPTAAPPMRSCSRVTGSRTSSCTSRAATPSSTTATSRASPATAGTSSRGRTCSPAAWRSTTTTT
jgi:glycosidase